MAQRTSLNNPFKTLAISIALAAIVGLAPAAWSQEQPAKPPTERTEPAEQQPPAQTPVERKSDAERIVDLKSAIEKSERQLTELRDTLVDPEGERADAEASFTELDRELKDKKKALDEAKSQPDDARTAKLQEEFDQVQTRWELAKKRFDLALQQQTGLQDQIQTLERRVAQDREALARLQAAPTTRPATPATSQEGAGVGTTTRPSAPTPQDAAPAATSPPAPVSQPPTDAAPPPAEQAAPAPTPAVPAPVSEELKAAKQAADEKVAEAQQAEAEVHSINERIETLQSQIASESKLLETEQQKAQLAREQQTALEQQIRERTAAGAPQSDVAALRDELTAARTREAASRSKIADRREVIDDLQSELIDLQVEQIGVLQEAETKRAEAETAAEEVAKLENPFNLQNVLQWLIDHGPRLLGIVIGALVLIWITKLAEHRMVDVLTGRKDHGSRAERENRARTLASVFRNVAYLVVVIGSILMVLTEVGIQIGPLLGGAAVIGLAIAFGTQSLVKDYFYGFIILMENQFTINDVVKIGDSAGLVERITLRMTVLRDLEGVVHFIPHGEATRVSNLTHGWSRAVIDVGVSYRENADDVMRVLSEIGQELYADPQFRLLMLSEPEILGLDALADSAIIIKLMVKTRPLHQWTIKREYLRRIKKRFDELGIEIPFPHRTVYHRWEEGQSLVIQRDTVTFPAPTDPHGEDSSPSGH